MPYANEHSCRLKPPNYKSYARKNCHAKHDGKCIDFIFGIKSANESELQAMRYDKKIWTEKDARSHCESKDGTFEPAKKEDKTEKVFETRHIPMEEMRALKDEDGKLIVEGYAIVYNREGDIWGDKEIILPGASTEALKAEDQYYLWQHDPKSPLARKKIGTLTAVEDKKGVFIRAEIVDTQFGQDCHQNIESGLVDKQSFAFRVADDKWKRVTIDGQEVWKRYIEKFSEIPEFSAVTFPVYEDTTLQARMRELALRNKPEPEASGEAGGAPPEVLKESRDNIEERSKLTKQRSDYES